MENCYHGGWPEEENWAQCHAPLNNESSYLVPWPAPPHVSASTRFQFHGLPSWSMPIEGVADDGGGATASSSKSHSQAEKRRRDRINAQLATLRKLIPKSDKMDKAALLGTVIDHVKDLKRKANEVSKACTLPTEVDEVTIDYDLAQDVKLTNVDNNSKDNVFIRASFCCDDRPELFTELIHVLKTLRLTAVKADIASVGGRIRSILVLCTKETEVGVCVSTLRQSLKLVLNKIASSSVQSNYRIRSKRQRFFLPCSQ
ncbi:hypothetical protein ACB098_06G140400 [Castanea mollissima]|uniref:BHLH domain-containing protein n=1 Tax=Castanea mollissima TaxID=60419 RepID=A0A8J4REE9_9ROSI|nr:hypothetical protein CMV_005007 [Castanea mollissima]